MTKQILLSISKFIDAYQASVHASSCRCVSLYRRVSVVSIFLPCAMAARLLEYAVGPQ